MYIQHILAFRFQVFKMEFSAQIHEVLFKKKRKVTHNRYRTLGNQDVEP